MLKLFTDTKQTQFEALDEVVRKAQNNFGSSASSVMVIQNDKIVYEQYHGYHHHKKGALPVTDQSLFNVYSTRKTYVCLAMALAALEYQVTLTTPLKDILSDYTGNDLGEITIRDLAVGAGPKFYNHKEWEREGIQGLIVREITGKTIAEFLYEKVILPLNCHGTLWATVPINNLVCDYATNGQFATVRLESSAGHERNLYTSTRDLANWGYLHLNQGVVGGNTLIPRDFFSMSELLREQFQSHRILGWYHQEEWYYATGAAGCHCVVYPEYNAVGVRMLNKYTSNYLEDQIEFNNTLLNCLR